MKTKTIWLAILAVVAALASAQTVNAQSRYSVTDLGTLPGLRNSFVWGGVNNQGHVAASVIDPTDVNAFAGAAMVGKKPTVSLMWPSGAELLVTYYPGWPGGGLPHLRIAWPLANGADHYRLTVVKKVKREYSVLIDASPANYVVYDGWASCTRGGPLAYATYTITVTAYSGPDETVAYSESLRTQITVEPMKSGGIPLNAAAL